MKTLLTCFACLFFGALAYGQQLAVLKYRGGGDWYANPTALPNLAAFCNGSIGTELEVQPATVTPESPAIFQYPYLHMTGHGNVLFSPEEAENLRTYLLSGGFLHIDDNYGMAPYLEKELPKLFPEQTWEELPSDHPVFQKPYPFPEGLPKIHEHDGKRPQAFGITIDGRLVLLFTFESDLGDGWEDPEVHNDPEQVRQTALKMGANIINYAFKN